MDIREIGWEGVNWIEVAQWWAVVDTIMKFRFHKSGQFTDQLSNYRLSRSAWSYEVINHWEIVPILI
jgi:hypothetical protein